MGDDPQIPNLFIIGAPKCGTTSLRHYLDQHPEIYMCPVKEPHYFNTDSGHRYYFDEKSYLKLFRKAPKEARYLGEASVWYLYSEKAISEILRFNPGARFLVLLRDPVSMFFSLHRQLLFGGAEDQRSPVRAWRLQEDRSGGTGIPKGNTDPSLLQYGAVCKLGAQLERVQNSVPDNQLKWIFLEDMKGDADAVYREVLAFLGVSDYSLNSYEILNEAGQRRSPLLFSVVRAINIAKRKLGIRWGIGASNAINRSNITDELDDISEEIATLTPELLAYFEKDIVTLEGCTGRNLSHWLQL